MVSPEDLVTTERHRQREQVPVADLFAEAALIAAEGRSRAEVYRLEAPPRRDRSSALLEVLDNIDASTLKGPEGDAEHEG